MAKRVSIDVDSLDGKLESLEKDFRERVSDFSDRVRADKARVAFNDAVRCAMENEHNRIRDAAKNVASLNPKRVRTDSKGCLDMTAYGREKVLGGRARSIEKLRADIGLDFPMAEKKADVDPNSVQYEKYLLGAIGSAPDASAGETHFPVWPKALAELVGRGGISRQELPFVIGGIEASRKTGVYEIATEHVDGFHNIDVLVPGEGIVRKYSSAAARYEEKMASDELEL